MEGEDWVSYEREEPCKWKELTEIENEMHLQGSSRSFSLHIQDSFKSWDWWCTKGKGKVNRFHAPFTARHVRSVARLWRVLAWRVTHCPLPPISPLPASFRLTSTLHIRPVPVRSERRTEGRRTRPVEWQAKDVRKERRHGSGLVSVPFTSRYTSSPFHRAEPGPQAGVEREEV